MAQFFNACEKDNLKIKNNKSHHFIQDKFILFGFEIDLKFHTIKPELDKVKKILDLQIPDTKKRVRTFIGAVGYFSNMLPHLQLDLAPLHDLAAPKTRFIWTEQCDNAFLTIKQNLAKLPFLHLLDPSKPVHFYFY